MAGMKMDPQQDAAVNTVGSDILVSASAGAGKTRVLIERLIKRCVQDRVPLDRILAVTFTQAAAAEMKNRAARRLQECLQASSDREEQQWLQQQIILLDSADITTIDAYCLSLIQKHYSVIGLDPAMASNILDDGMHDQYLREAFRTVLAEAEAAQPEELRRALEICAPHSEDYDTLLSVLTAVISHADSSISPDAWFHDARVSAGRIRRLEDLPGPLLDAFYDDLQLRYDTCLEDFADMEQAAQESEKLMKKSADLKAAGNLLKGCAPFLSQRSYDMFRTAFFAFGEQAKTPSDGSQKTYMDARKALFAHAGALAEQLYDSALLVSDHNDLVPLSLLLLDLAERTRTEFLAVKRSHACMDFADMERFALEILEKNDGAVARILQNSLDEVMVDEFQDTSLLQNLIITRLARPGTVFRVGDVKQSIYRFRQAKPALMRGLMQDASVRQITLEHNYRSKENVVSCCNALFSRLMNVPGCADRYETRDIVSIGTDRQKLSAPQPIQMVLLSAPSDEKEDQGAAAARMRKADWISGEILRLVREQGYSYEDVAVLVRSHHDKGVLRESFDRYGIPYDIDAREGFFRSPLCQTILGILHAMIDPNDPIALLTVLTSPFCGLSDAELAGMKIRHASMHEAVAAEHPELLQELQELRAIARGQGLAAMLSEIACRHSFYEALDEGQKANFDFLFEKAVKLEETSRSVHDLAAMMEASEQESSSEAITRGRDDKVVTVTTIHQSKGLQYRAVFLWGTGQNLAQENRDPVLVDDDLFLGIRHVDLPWHTVRTTVDRIAVAGKQNREDLEEFTRLLYVALTRAEERLYLVDSEDSMRAERPAVTLPVLNARKGLTGLVLAAMNDVPDLFEIHHLLPQAVTKAPPLPSRYVKALPRYAGPQMILPPVMTPSETEMTFLPDLDPASDDGGKRHGTLMHEALAALPDRLWTAADLEPLELSAADRGHILAFGSSDLYREALGMEIHHEFPFYIETDRLRMHGAMDFVAVSESQVLLIDYKTDSVPPAEIARRYRDQLNAYRQALQILYPDHEIRVYAWSLHANDSVLITP